MASRIAPYGPENRPCEARGVEGVTMTNEGYDQSGEYDDIGADATVHARLVSHILFATAYGTSKDDTDLERFVTAYVECALWSSTDESDDRGGDPLDDNYGPEDIDQATLASMVKDCADFIDDAADLIGDELEQAGRDFWLTRNRHGAGFWDGDWEDGGELTKMAHAYGSVDLYVGDDGKVYGN